MKSFKEYLQDTNFTENEINENNDIDFESIKNDILDLAKKALKGASVTSFDVKKDKAYLTLEFKSSSFRLNGSISFFIHRGDHSMVADVYDVRIGQFQKVTGFADVLGAMAQYQPILQKLVGYEIAKKMYEYK